MKPRICVCCGEPMVEGGNGLSRNPNVCASCSSLADGMERLPAEEIADSGPVEEGSVEHQERVVEWVMQKTPLQSSRGV